MVALIDLIGAMWTMQRLARETRSRARDQYQRLTKGYADIEAWNLDGWLCEALGVRLARLAEHHVAYPGVGIYADAEAWGRDLRTHADALLAYRGWDDLDVSADEAQRTIDAAKRALAWVSEWLPYLWD